MFNHNDEFEELRFVLNSKMRSKLIMTLLYSGKNLEDLRLIFNKPSSTILHTLHELILLDLVNKVGKSYKLSSRGYIFALVMHKFIMNLYFIHNSQEFLDNHSLNSIPVNLLKDLYLLTEGEYVLSNEKELSKPLNEYLGIISDANELNIILPIFSQIHLDGIMESIEGENNKKLTLLTTPSIFKSLKKGGYMTKLLKLSKSKDVSVWKYEGDLDVFLTFGKKFSVISLFFEDNHFDDSVLFVDKTKNSVKWSKNILNQYIEKSLKVL